MPEQARLGLVPYPREVRREVGVWTLNDDVTLRLGAQSHAVGAMLLDEWPKVSQVSIQNGQAISGPWGFELGDASTATLSTPSHPQGYALQITAQGVAAVAGAEAGLMYAWQTLKQLVRQSDGQLPCLHVRDWPSLDWRVYHIDLKGTRRTLENLHAILPRLAELKINAVLVEYEDYLRLDSHPDLAVAEALRPAQVKAWIAEAQRYHVQVIPLIQTLGHFQYVLSKPAYAHLAEEQERLADACPSHPETWPLIRDFLDEMMELHADAPFIHVGLDETRTVGTCSRCQARLAGRPISELVLDWFNQVCGYVSQRGFTPMAWADMVTAELDPTYLERLPRDVVLVDWSYFDDAATSPALSRFKGARWVSRQWLRRPEDDRDQAGPGYYTEAVRHLEDLDEESQRRVRPLLDNPAYPKQVRTLAGHRMLAEAGLSTFGGSGIRISAHGCLVPDFIGGQRNTVLWGQACRDHGSRGLIATSWSRGNSFVRTNPHPELDWYGIATLADAGWGQLDLSSLREFDRRFARQFFGLSDGEIGDLLDLIGRTMPRVDILHDSYLHHVAERLAILRPQVQRHLDVFDLIDAAVGAMRLRHEAQACLLQWENASQRAAFMPEGMRQKIRHALREVIDRIDAAIPLLAKRYSHALTQRDAEELARTQLEFVRDQLAMLLTHEHADTTKNF